MSAQRSRAIAVDFSLTGQPVTEVLDRVAILYGLPKLIQGDNGPAFISKALDAWAYRRGVKPRGEAAG